MNDYFSASQIVAEMKIAEAIQNGELDNLPGMGKPLPEEDLSHVPQELRMAYHILKNASCLPPEIEDRKEINHLADLLDNCADEKTNLQATRRLRLLLNRLGSRRNAFMEAHDEYYQKIIAKLEKQERKLHAASSSPTPSRR